jgi:hypothetical protein
MSNLKRNDRNKREKLYELLITTEQKFASTNIIEESMHFKLIDMKTKGM